MKSHISGFPEFLPQSQPVFFNLIDLIAEILESFAFERFETSPVELMTTLLSKGDDTEIYSLQRYHWYEECCTKIVQNVRDIQVAIEETVEALDSLASGVKANEVLQSTLSHYKPELGLRFDLTISLARYIAQHSHAITFPFKRYSLGQVWRGERAQLGRYRQFYQMDCDILNRGELNIYHDAEILAIVLRVFESLVSKGYIAQFQIFINHRKILMGVLSSMVSIDDQDLNKVIRLIDKVDKLSFEKWSLALQEFGFTEKDAQQLIFLRKRCMVSPISELRALNIADKSYLKGVEDLANILEYCGNHKDGYCHNENISFDILLARGLEYYTGMIYEVILPDMMSLGSVCGGGRYDNLVTNIANSKTSGVFPGVGVSFGISRLMTYLVSTNERLERVGGANYTSCNKILIISKCEDNKINPSTLSTVRNTVHNISKNLICDIYLEQEKYDTKIKYAKKKKFSKIIWVSEELFVDGSVQLENLDSGEKEKITIKMSDLDKHLRF